jgi:AraC-type DNA-binding domain-containing proteins
MLLRIKNMVCDRCKWVVKNELEKLGHEVMVISLGEAELKNEVSPDQLAAIEQKLKEFGFELINDKSSILIEQIKTLIIELVRHPQQLEKQNLSQYLSQQLHKDYSSLSKLFSEVSGITIEQYFILQKIEKAKELIVYDELTLTQIADELGYSSVAHLSNQFKKITGLTPRHFKELKHKHRKGLDQV